jgi:histidyl-tRNA synthetase
LATYCQVDFKIVRGLAYYTGIVWEIHDRKGELRAIAGGGRYDNLIKQVSSVELPALGFGMGDVVLGELLKDRGLLPREHFGPDCYVVIADELLRPEALGLIHQLRDAGLAVDYSLTPAKVGKQFQAASTSGARYAITVGPEEWKVGAAKLKNLGSKLEEEVKIGEIVGRMKSHSLQWRDLKV